MRSQFSQKARSPNKDVVHEFAETHGESDLSEAPLTVFICFRLKISGRGRRFLGS